MFCAGAAWAQDGRWWRAESAKFIVYGEGGERQVRDAARALEDFDIVLRTLTNPPERPSTNKLEVFLVRNHAGLLQANPSLDSNVAGFYQAGSEQIAAFAIDDRGSEGREILFHEYAHHYMLHNFPSAYPRWYVEGFAELVSTTEIRMGQARVGRNSERRASWLQYADLLTIEQLLRPERYERSPEFEARFYALSWLAAIYLFNNSRYQRGLERYVEALSGGADSIEAFEPAFGVTPETFERELRAFRRGRIGIIGIALPDQTAPITVTRLPAEADALLLPLARLRIRGSARVQPELAAEMERLARPYENTHMGRIALARAAMMREDFDSARTTLEAMVAEGANDAEVRYLLAYITLLSVRGVQDYARVSAAIADVRAQLAASFRAHPDYFPTLYLYAWTFTNGRDPLSEAQLNILDRALDLAPQSSEIRLLFAQELMRAREFETAELVLQPLIYAPHNPGAAARARILLDTARRRAPPPVFVDVEGEEAEAD